LEKLIKDGRIQPLKIEQLVALTKQEMDKNSHGRRQAHLSGSWCLQFAYRFNQIIGKYKFGSIMGRI
jgi:hypothetical protein